MNYNEPDAAKRRIPIYLETTAGVPVTGATFLASAIRVSKSGGTMANSLGTVVEVGFGLYYYIATQAETVTFSYIMIAATAAGAKKYVYSVDIGNRITVGNATAAARHIPIYLENSSGNGVAGLSLAGLSTYSKNGATFVAPAGTFTELELGAYDYQATQAEIDTGGIGVLRVTDPSIVPFVYTWDVVTQATGAITVSNVTPVPPLPVLPQDVIQFDITAPAGFAQILPMVSLNPYTVPEPVHNGTDFEPLYLDGGSVRAAITDGYRYTILRKGGWYAQPHLIVYAVDLAGNSLTGP